MEDFYYNGIVEIIAQAFEREIGQMSVVYNFDYGDEFEISICKVLRKFLPLKYGVCRGFVVDKHGNTAGDDIIIYDQELYPTLRFIELDNQFAQKQQIPVEAVYAYIEAKHTLNSTSLLKAVKQVGEVKKMCYSRMPVPRIGIKKETHIFDNEYSKMDGWNPIISNPVYGMILSAHCTAEGKGECGENTTQFVYKQIQEELWKNIEKQKFCCFDSIIAGKSTTAFCGHYIYDKNGCKTEGIQLTRFSTGIRPGSCYQVNTHENIAFGLGMAHLMMALNFIKLGDMPWDFIFNTAKMPNVEERNKLLKILEENEKY